MRAAASPTYECPESEADSVPSRKFVSYIIDKSRFDLPTQYQPIKSLGKSSPFNRSLLGHGAYGVVCKAVNTLTQEQLAIKKVPNPFATLTNAKNLCREIKLMRFLKHMNIVGLRDILNPVSINLAQDVTLSYFHRR